MEGLLYVLLGWALGLLTYPIGRAIDRNRQADEIRPVLLQELQELGLTLGILCYDLGGRHGLLDANKIELLGRISESYDGPADEVAGLDALRTMLALEGEALEAAKAAWQALGFELRLTTYALPFLEAQVHRLDLLEPQLQQDLLQIHQQLEMFNGQVDFVMQQFDKTFDPSITGDNRNAVLQNIVDTHHAIVRRAQTIVTKIINVLDRYDTMWA